MVNPDGAEWRYRFDPADRLISETDFIGRSLEYRYDAAGRLIARSTGTGTNIALDRDAVGRLVARHTADGSFTYAYDVAGRLAIAAGPGTSIEYQRDALGHVVAETVDGRTTTFAYDAMGRRIGRTTPTGAISAWDYDLAGRPSSLRAGSGYLTVGYDAVDRETERVLGPGAWLTNDFGESGRISAQRLFVGDRRREDHVGDPALTRAWQWRGDGILLQIDDSLRGTRRFDVDPAGRISTVSADTWNESYSYDAFGNVTATDTGDEDITDVREVERTLIRSAGRSTYERDEIGRLVRTVRRTLDGRRKVWQYTWDAEDRLVQAVTPEGVTWQYTYDPLSRRTGKLRLSDDGAIAERVIFTWDGHRVAEQHTRGPDNVMTTLTWDYDPGSFRPAAQRRRSWAADAPQEAVDEVFHAIVTDLIGTPTELVTPEGRIAWRTTTSLWGRSTSTNADPDVDCPLRFPGQYFDAETGLHYNLHRYYDPDTAGYLTPDPLGLAAGPNDHAYVPNPLVFMDPLGLVCGQRVYQKAVDEADRAANEISSNQRPAVSEAIQIGAGPNARFYTSLSGQSQELAPEVQAVLDRVPAEERGVGHGRCGLPSCLTQAINDGVDPTGAKVAAVLIKNNPEKWDHGVPIGPCDSCKHLVDHFDLDFVE